MANEFVAVINGYKVKDNVARTRADQAVSEVSQIKTAVKTIKSDVDSLKKNASEGVDTDAVYNIIETHIDKTLTLDNKLADAKAVGDKITQTKAQLEAKISEEVGNAEFKLSPATSTTLGGVKVGAGLSVASDGTISATGEGGVADSVEWDNVVGKPSTFTPAPHTHTWTQVAEKPETFAPSAHSHGWDEVSGKPEVFAPEDHGHAWGEITEKPSVYPPETHTHTPDEIGALPDTYVPPVTSVNGKTGDVTVAGLELVELWENASPESAFPAQTLSLDLSNYAMVVLTSIRSSSLLLRQSAVLIVGEEFPVTIMTTGNSFVYRRMTVKTDGIEFEDGKTYGTYGTGVSTSDNSHAIPIKLYGVVGGKN